MQELKALDIRMENLMLKFAGEQWANAVKERLAGNPYFRFISRLTGLRPKAGKRLKRQRMKGSLQMN
ncbi:hypothetical protein PO124_04195 [Bacillus licheniformis]|nr:hypothetical protein [Bacillus licheniformis]